MTNTTGQLHFRATPDDIKNLEAIAAALRLAGRPFSTRTDALRAALEAAASNPAAVLEAAK